jgi:hypothetical protein
MCAALARGLGRKEFCLNLPTCGDAVVGAPGKEFRGPYKQWRLPSAAQRRADAAGFYWWPGATCWPLSVRLVGTRCSDSHGDDRSGEWQVPFWTGGGRMPFAGFAVLPLRPWEGAGLKCKPREAQQSAAASLEHC